MEILRRKRINRIQFSLSELSSATKVWKHFMIFAQVIHS